MIRRAFQPAISLLILLGLPALLSADTLPQTASTPEVATLVPPQRAKNMAHLGEAEAITSKALPEGCHDSYSVASFEKANDDLQEFIDEYFHDARIPFFPTKKQLKNLGLLPKEKGVYQKPHALKRAGGHRRYPITPGLWKAIDLGDGVWEYHLLIREPQCLAETQAFNTDNDLLGEPFADYDDQAYIMLLQPEDVRRRSMEHFFTINVHVYGLRDDATALPRTVSDVILTDYTAWVEQNRRCQAQGGQP